MEKQTETQKARTAAILQKNRSSRTETTFEVLIRADEDSPWHRSTRSYGNADAAIVAADRYQANGNETLVQKVTTTWETVA